MSLYISGSPRPGSRGRTPYHMQLKQICCHVRYITDILPLANNATFYRRTRPMKIRASSPKAYRQIHGERIPSFPSACWSVSIHTRYTLSAYIRSYTGAHLCSDVTCTHWLGSHFNWFTCYIPPLHEETFKTSVSEIKTHSAGSKDNPPQKKPADACTSIWHWHFTGIIFT